MADVLTTFVKALGRYQIEASLFVASQRVLSAIEELFFQILLLIIYYRAHLSQSRLKRFLKAGLVSGIDDVANALKTAAIHLNSELRTAALEGTGS